MRVAGIDIGSRTIELVLVENSQVIESRQSDTGFDPVFEARKLMKGLEYDAIMATGYGRNLFENAFEQVETITEIKAHATGARAVFPEARTVLDIGGQDNKAISLDDKGRITKFEMNDRCAAGTGKFLEIMARNLGFTLEGFGPAAIAAEKALSINSMCTVFAESEVTSLIAKGADRGNIAKGLHLSVVKRVSGMLNRVSSFGPIVFSGGGGRNPCICKLIAETLEREVLVPESPEMIGALGAALIMECRAKVKLPR